MEIHAVAKDIGDKRIIVYERTDSEEKKEERKMDSTEAMVKELKEIKEVLKEILEVMKEKGD